MVTYVQNGRVAEFVCAAGVLPHYVGDACQRLHVSRFHHGYGVDDGSRDQEHPLPADISVAMEGKVHASYEEQMLEGETTAKLIAGVNEQLDGRTLPDATITSGQDAGMAVVALMK